jgi:thymidylate synthase
MIREIDKKYLDMVKDIYNNGKVVYPRGLECRELLGYRFELSDISGDNNIIKVKGLETNISYAMEEFAWYLSGNPSIDFSPRIKRIWEKYSDDGKTVNSNYGNRIFTDYDNIGVKQWDWIKDELTRDPDSRRAVININSINDKKLVNPKDFPCTNTIQYFIRDNKLDEVVSMRSNDVFLGFRNDIYCFTEFQKKMADELNIIPGRYIQVSNSMHLYNNDYDKVKKVLSEVE